MLKHSLVIGGLSVALVVATAAPASAAPWDYNDIIVGDSTDYTYWDLDDQGSIDHSGIIHDDADNSLDREFDRVWCGTSGGLELDGNYMSVSGPADIVTDASGDQVVTVTGTFGSLDAAAEYRVYAEGDLIRTSYVVTNNTGSAITVTPLVEDDTSDNYGSGTTMSGDESFDSGDLWWTQYNASFDGRLELSALSPSVVFGRHYGSIGQISIENIESADELFTGGYPVVTFNDVTIEPGASYQWVFFYQMLDFDQSAGEGDVTAAAAAAASNGAADEFGGTTPYISGRLSRGLDLTIPLNWLTSAPVPPAAPQLAETGSDASGLGLGALLALVLGGAAIAYRRRTAAS